MSRVGAEAGQEREEDRDRNWVGAGIRQEQGNSRAGTGARWRQSRAGAYIIKQ